MESWVGLFVTKINGCLLYFVADNSVLDFGVVLPVSLDINCLKYIFYDRCKQSIYNICKYDLGNLILLQNKSGTNNNNNNNNNNNMDIKA